MSIRTRYIIESKGYLLILLPGGPIYMVQNVWLRALKQRLAKTIKQTEYMRMIQKMRVERRSGGTRESEIRNRKETRQKKPRRCRAEYAHRRLLMRCWSAWILVVPSNRNGTNMLWETPLLLREDASAETDGIPFCNYRRRAAYGFIILSLISVLLLFCWQVMGPLVPCFICPREGTCPTE